MFFFCSLSFTNSIAAGKSNPLVEFYTSVYLSACSAFCVSSDIVFLPQAGLDFGGDTYSSKDFTCSF